MTMLIFNLFTVVLFLTVHLCCGKLIDEYFYWSRLNDLKLTYSEISELEYHNGELLLSAFLSNFIIVNKQIRR